MMELQNRPRGPCISPPAAAGVKVWLFSGTQRDAVDKAVGANIRAVSAVVKAECGRIMRPVR